MPTKFETRMRGNTWATLVRLFGRSVTYTPSGQGGVAIDAIWRPGVELPTWTEEDSVIVKLGVLTVHPSDVAAPSYDDTVTIGTDTYAVQGKDDSTPFFLLQLVQYETDRSGGEIGTIQR